MEILWPYPKKLQFLSIPGVDVMITIFGEKNVFLKSQGYDQIFTETTHFANVLAKRFFKS
jgi:hypothetical protein